VKKILKRYLPFMVQYKVQYLLVLIGIILTVLSLAGTAYIMKPMMDDMFIAKKESYIVFIPVALVVLYVVKSLGRYLQTVYMAYIGTHIIALLREKMLLKIISLDMSFLYINKSGELISKLQMMLGECSILFLTFYQS